MTKRHVSHGMIALMLLTLAGGCSGKSKTEAHGQDAAAAGSASCTPTAPDVGAAICSGTGRLSCANPKLACPAYKSAPVTVGLSTTAYQGSLTQCDPLADPAQGKGFLVPVRAESVQLKTFPSNGAVQLETWVHVARTDLSPNCGILANFRSLLERPHIDTGMTFKIGARKVDRSDIDTPSINGLWSDTGELLYALVLSSSLTHFAEDFGDLLPGLNISAGGDALCLDSAGSGAFRTSLSVGAETCSVDPQSSRCCSLWGRNYEVEVLSAVASPGSTAVQVGFALRAEGFFYRPD
jgi:hypothetical protein